MIHIDQKTRTRRQPFVHRIGSSQGLAEKSESSLEMSLNRNEISNFASNFLIREELRVIWLA